MTSIGERADVLGVRVNGHPEEVDAALPELEALVVVASDPDDVWEVVQALRLCDDERASELVLRLVGPHHPDPEVRQQVASTIGSVVTAEPFLSQVTAALVVLTGDVDEDVRDWACFGLGQLGVGGPEVADALATRLDDPHVDTRCEALLALAALGDARVLPVLLARLGGEADGVRLLELEAAEALADPALGPALRHLDRGWSGDDDRHTEVLARALRRCDPTAPALAAVLEAEVLVAANRGRPAGQELVLDGSYPRTTVRWAGKPVPVGTDVVLVWSDRAPSNVDLHALVRQLVG